MRAGIVNKQANKANSADVMLWVIKCSEFQVEYPADPAFF